MNRKQRVELIVKTLLWCYTRPPFSDKDLLYSKARAYRELVDSDYTSYEKKNVQYQKVRNELSLSVQKEVHLERLSEVTELLEMFYPENEMANYLSKYPASLAWWYLDRLIGISTEFITLRDGVVSIKMWSEDSGSGSRHKEIFPDHSGLYKVELWSEVSRVITPDTLIAAYFVQCGIREESYLRNLPENISLSDSVLARINQRGVAETHLHMSVGMSYLTVWEAVTDLSAIRSQKATVFQAKQQQALKENYNLVAAGMLRVILADYLSQDKASTLDLMEYWKTQIYRDAVYNEAFPPGGFEWDLLSAVLHEEPEAELHTVVTAFWQRKQQIHGYLMTQYMHLDQMPDVKQCSFDMVAYNSGFRVVNTAPELILLHRAFFHIRDNPAHQQFAKVFLCYLRIKNEYFSKRFQNTDVRGLTFFRQYFRKSASSLKSVETDSGDTVKKMIYRAVFRNQFHCKNLKKLEVKLSPPFRGSNLSVEFTCQQLARKIAGSLIDVIEAYLTVLDESGRKDHNDAPTLGIVYHFIREDIYHPSHSFCWVDLSDWNSGDYVSRIRQNSQAFLCALHYMLRTIPGLSELIVGLDTASEELYAEPWVYAPVYHYARSRMNTYPIQLDSRQAMQNIGLTYHVGEDYHHILSGLRHIDEVLTHFGYKAGDRIGHGLVLQLDIAQWTDDHEVVSLPIMEYMEDLLWVWYLCGQDGENLASFRPEIEQEIMQVAEELYHNIRGITPYVLWKTYQRKFEPLSDEFRRQMCQAYLRKEEEVEVEPIVAPSYIPAQRGFCILQEQSQRKDFCTSDMVWDVDKLLTTHYCPIYRRSYKRPHFVHNRSHFLPLFQAVQQYVKRKIQAMGIYVETNPTSNLAIGDFSGLCQYPIAALNSPVSNIVDAPAIMLTINSDDPLVFNTNVENEIALVYHALNYKNIPREEVLHWIDKVRQYGVDSSFIRRVRTVKEEREFLEGIRDELQDMRNQPPGS